MRYENLRRRAQSVDCMLTRTNIEQANLSTGASRHPY